MVWTLWSGCRHRLIPDTPIECVINVQIKSYYKPFAQVCVLFLLSSQFPLQCFSLVVFPAARAAGRTSSIWLLSFLFFLFGVLRSSKLNCHSRCSVRAASLSASLLQLLRYPFSPYHHYLEGLQWLEQLYEKAVQPVPASFGPVPPHAVPEPHVPVLWAFVKVNEGRE
jgi:hypothetical protein